MIGISALRFRRLQWVSTALICLCLLSSCGWWGRMRMSKAEKKQSEYEVGRENDRRNRERAQMRAREDYINKQSKETRRRMRANQRRSNRINAGKPDINRNGKKFRLFKRPRWWRK